MENFAMTIDQIIALVASIGACLSAVAAFFTIRQVSKQTENSYRPELAISRTMFKSIPYSTSAGSIPDRWVKKEEESPNIRGPFTIPLHNVGLGAARDLKVQWSFPIEEATSKINELAQKSLTPIFYEYKNGQLFYKSDEIDNGASLWKNQQEETIDFVLPASASKALTDLKVPHAFIKVVSALVHFNSKSEDFESLDGIPNLIANICYFDIGGKKYETKFTIKPDIYAIMGAGESFEACLEATNIVEGTTR